MRTAGLGLLTALSLMWTGCSGGPAPPQPGTPAFYWGAARETFRTGDYLKTAENLGQIAKTENPYNSQARPWEVVLTAGICRGFRELADIYDDGARRNRANPTPFRRRAVAFRGYASSAALQYTEALHLFMEKNKDATLPLVFDFPAGNLADPPQLKRITNGILIPDAEVELAQKAMIQRGVLRQACRTVGAPEDPAKALEIFQKGNVQTKRDVFMLAVAKTLVEESELFGPAKLDQPSRLKVMCREALEALEAVPASKEKKQLTGTIQAALKKIRPT